MKKRNLLILGAVFLLGIIGYIGYSTYDYTRVIAPNQLSKKDKVEDFNQLYTTIVEGYPFLEVNKRMNGVDFASKKDEYLKRIRSADTDKSFEYELELIMRDLNNGHSHIVSREDMKDGFSIYAYLEPFKNIYKDLFSDDKVTKRYGVINNDTATSSMDNIKSGIEVKDVIKDKVAYMYLPRMIVESVAFDEDMRVIDNYISTRRNYKALIIDIRGNEGGNTGYWWEIVSKLIKEPVKHTIYTLFRANNPVIKEYAYGRMGNLKAVKDLSTESMPNIPKETTMFTHYANMEQVFNPDGKGGFNGKIYLLVDKAVYSSAEALAVFCKESGFATIVGEKTGGDGIGVDPVLFNLKNSGIVVRMPSEMGLTESGICNEEFKTTPDIGVKSSRRMNSFDIDECVQKVLELEKLN